MHQSVKDHLEECLRGESVGELPPEIAAHLAACSGCSGELNAMRAQSRLLRALRTPAEAEPRPGFYARVLDRIERQTDNSIWAVLLRPTFGLRIALASAAFVVLLGGYLVTSEAGAQSPAAQQSVQAESNLPQQRDAVLVSLASYQAP